jgi:hypothetical protein
MRFSTLSRAWAAIWSTSFRRMGFAAMTAHASANRSDHRFFA